MPLHPEAQQLLAALEAAGLPPFEHMTVPQAREATKGFIDLQGEPEEIATEERTIPGPAGEIPVRVYTPAGEGPKPVIVYFHGGGWVIGELDTVDNPLRRIANRTGAVVVSVDYRLAPEHVYPAAFDDSYAATAWVAEHAAELDGDPERIAVGGDSAGGNLAAAVAIAARDRQGPRLAAQLLIYPVTDFDFTSESYEQNGEGYLLTKGSMQWFWAHYLGAQDLGKDPYACPARADDLAGLPPAFVATAEFDPLRDEGEAYAANLRIAGVDVTAKRYDGMVHGFAWTLGATPSGAALIDDLAAAFGHVLEGAR
jgi:acetyl esterase